MASEPYPTEDVTDAPILALPVDERERLFRLAFDLAPVGAALLDAERRFVHVNDATCGMTGYSRAEMLRMSVSELTHPDERDADLQRHERLRTGLIRENRHVKRFVGKQGEVRWAEVVVRPLDEADDVPTLYLALITDITERRRLEVDLENEHQRLVRLVDNSEDAILEGGQDGSILSANAAACRILGRSEAELRALGRSGVLDLTDPRTTRAIRTRERSGAFTGELRLLRGDGSAFTGDVSTRMYTDADGGQRTSIVIRDVSAREQAAAALRVSEERYRSVVAASSEGLMLQARDGRILAWNDAAMKITGVTGDDIVGGSAVERDWQSIHEDGRPWPASEHPSMVTLATGEPQKDQVVGLRRDGEIRWILVNTSPVLAPDDDRPWAVAVACADITAHKATLDALRRSEAIRDVAERVGHSGSYRWDFATRRTEWSPGMFTLFDVDPEGFDGDVQRVLEARVHTDDRARILEIADTVAVGGPPVAVEYRVIHRDGSAHVLHTEFSVEHDGSGAPIGIVGYYRDVTELRRAEEAIRRLGAELTPEASGDGA